MEATPGRRTVLSAVPAALLGAARELGLQAEELRRRAGLGPLDDPDDRVPIEAHLRLLGLLCAHRPPLGLELGTQLGARSFGIVGYAMQHDATLGSALRWLERHRALLHEELVGTLELVPGPPALAVVCHDVRADLRALREPAEIWAAAELAVLRSLTGRELQPLHVAFPHSRPADDARHRALFRCPLRWEAPRIELAFEREVLELPLARSHPELFGYLTRQTEQLAARLPELGLTERVEAALERALAEGEPSMPEIAANLGLSPRTLQRRLGEAGTSFAALLDRVRRGRALALLDGSRLSLTEIGYLLGYSEPAAFFRAFRRWTGTTPELHRTRTRP